MATQQHYFSDHKSYLFSDTSKVTSQSIIDQIMPYIDKWQAVFPYEPTWIYENHGIPSPIIRVDCIIINGKVFILEVEDRPQGFGVAYRHHQNLYHMIMNCLCQFQESNKGIVNHFLTLFGFSKSSINFVQSETRFGDDHLVFKQVSLKKALRSHGLIIPRCRPTEIEYHSLRSKSLFPISTEGDKAYGIDLGIYLDVADYQKLDLAQVIVYKPAVGTRTREIKFCFPDGDSRKELADSQHLISEKKLAKKKHGFVQQYVEPATCPDADYPDHYSIDRLYFTYINGKYEYAGGYWFATPGILVHGTDGCITGNIL